MPVPKGTDKTGTDLVDILQGSAPHRAFQTGPFLCAVPFTLYICLWLVAEVSTLRFLSFYEYYGRRYPQMGRKGDKRQNL